MNWIATDAVREKSRTLSMKNYPLLNIAVHLGIDHGDGHVYDNWRGTEAGNPHSVAGNSRGGGKFATDAVREKSRTLSMKNYPLLNIAVHLVRTSPLRGCMIIGEAQKREILIALLAIAAEGGSSN
jgi:hypothetical protein